MRRIRNIAVYEEIDYVTEKTAKEVIEQAELFVRKIRTSVHKIRTK